MRRFALSLLLTVLAVDGISYAAQDVRKKPAAKKPAAGQPTASKATRPSASPSTPPKTARPAGSVVDEAGNRAAAQAASERVHAWMKEHNEVITDDYAQKPVAHKPVAAATPTKPVATKQTAVDNNGQSATTNDFLKAAEQRKAIEEKKAKEKKEETTEPESSIAPPTEPSDDEGKAVTPATKSAVAVKPTLVLAKPVAPASSTAENPVDRSARKQIIEKSASELPAPPVLAVKRTELVAEDAPDTSPTRITEPKLSFRRGRLVIPAPLLGSHAILVHQNIIANKYGLERIQDDGDIERLRKQRQLIALPDNKNITVDDRLPDNRRYARPWTVKFLNDLARTHNVRFHDQLQVNSAVRTVEFQLRLMRTNGNAAPAEGDTASPHLTGQAIDIAKHGLSMTEIAWMRAYLLPLVQEGKIDVEEEFQQACFHISVYKSYAPEPKAKAKGSRLPKAALATALP